MSDTESIEKVVVIGTGFVGLPLALVLAERGKTVYGVDIDENVVKAINDATLEIDEAELERLLESPRVQENLVAQTSPSTGDAFVISVPTPLSEPAKSPDLSHIEAAVESIIPYLEPGNVVNVESTIPPLTCENFIAPRLREAGFSPGEDIHLTHSPERILPGNVFEEIVTNDRIVGGYTDEGRALAAKLYEPFLEGEIYYTDLTSAELCKLMENTFRDVNVGLANEFALIGDELDVDVSAVIELANKHPRVDILSPGIGVGGHCLPVDPWFLNEVDPEHTDIITTARRINDAMPVVVARKIRHAVAGHTDPRILALGISYKPNTYDQRNSPAKRVVEELRLDGYDIVHKDPHVEGSDYDEFTDLLAAEEPDVVVELVPHDRVVSDLREHADLLSSEGIEVLRPGSGNPLDPA